MKNPDEILYESCQHVALSKESIPRPPTDVWSERQDLFETYIPMFMLIPSSVFCSCCICQLRILVECFMYVLWVGGKKGNGKVGKGWQMLEKRSF